MTVAQAAKIIGCSQHYVRIAMQRGYLNIGSCVKMSSRWTYNIQPAKVAEYMGVSLEEIERL